MFAAFNASKVTTFPLQLLLNSFKRTSAVTADFIEVKPNFGKRRYNGI